MAKKSMKASKGSKPAIAIAMPMPVSRGGTTYGDSGDTMAERGAIGSLGMERGPLGPASQPNTPDGTAPNMAY